MEENLIFFFFSCLVNTSETRIKTLRTLATCVFYIQMEIIRYSPQLVKIIPQIKGRSITFTYEITYHIYADDIQLYKAVSTSNYTSFNSHNHYLEQVNSWMQFNFI